MIIYPADQLRNLVHRRQTARNLVFKGADLRGIQLSGLRADGLDLEEADLRESSLIEVKWKGCILRDALLDAADFTDAVLRLCDFDQVRATDAIFVRTRLENSTACGARFDRADLTGASLIDTDFSRASLRGANLEGVSASGAHFRGADLRGARLQNAELVDTDLRGADLTDADLHGANLSGADLRGVVGYDPALQKEDSQWGELPPEMRDLSETMTPIVLEVLRTAGRRGAIDAKTAERLIEQAARRQSASPRNAPSADTMKAVSQVLDELGDNVLPALIGALQQPNEGEPPPEVKAMILRLREALSLDETASAEDVLSRLVNGIGRSLHFP
ncbi:MAG: pentapeptide repeat-containing protein [Chloroflexia bacterium]